MRITGKSVMIGVLGAITVLTAGQAIAETSGASHYATTYTVNESVKTDGKCAHTPKTPCTQIKVSYPVFSQGSQPSGAIDAINASVQRFLLQSASEDQPPATIEAAMGRFFQNYQSAIRQFPQQGVWADEKQVQVIHNRPNLLSLQYAHYWYTGGAHPNSSRTYWNFNPQTGKTIQLSDLLVKGYAPQLNAIAEKHFRRVKELTANESLTAAGFWFDHGKFQLNRNFALTPKGLLFFFNTYEIGPYVMGPTELLIPYPELKGLVKNQALLPMP
ncbi:DUF3298 and DUF4163 domain-containing protein [Acaryochloris sp. IP29b_bin.148]|uniref:DUF3298 and DUF4163 domain-containing protein n=1 Tax=Acaryochloris sp. IP29b_bin.148 TaxID=2969218 RepID=UPI00260CB2C2|nr:DUF3298 and DUF4163 domain-containing protein [Acaryochloris sp. IP29b_bin.148]